MNKGTWYAIGAYACWGLFPLYWKMLHHISALQLISHRIIWSFVLMLIIILWIKQWKSFYKSVLSINVLKIYGAAALLVGINWLTYVWAVNAGHIVETSLGYFINPLLSVMMGVWFLRERLRPWQWASVGLTTAGVLYLTFAFGSLPWIALTLAISFATYGLMKKIAPLSSLSGLTLETGILFIPAVIYLLMAEKAGDGAFLHTSVFTNFLLIGSGVVTTIPLLLFASAARRIPLSAIGILQYIAPTIQFLIGVLVYKEPFTYKQFVGYGTVWLALLIFGIDSYRVYRVQTMKG